jgi:hypothetical protein
VEGGRRGRRERRGREYTPRIIDVGIVKHVFYGFSIDKIVRTRKQN